VETLFDSMPPKKHGDSGHDESIVRAIGISLLSGFALMLLYAILFFLLKHEVKPI